MRNNTRALVEGAISAALFTMLLLLVVFTPIGGILYLVLPLPFTVYTYRHTWKKALLLGVVTLFLSIPIGSILLMPLVLTALIIGTVLGASFAKQHSPIQTLLWGTVASFLSFLLIIAVSSAFLQMNLIEQMTKIMDESFAINEAIIKRIAPGQEDLFAEMKEQTMKAMEVLLPAMIISASAVLGSINYWIGYKLLKRLKMNIKPFPPFGELSFPRSILYYYIVALLLLFILATTESNNVFIMISNLQFILQYALILQGLLFVFFIAMHRKMGKGLPILAVVLLFIPPFTNILLILGIVDLGLNMRKKLSSGS